MNEEKNIPPVIMGGVDSSKFMSYINTKDIEESYIYRGK